MAENPNEFAENGAGNAPENNRGALRSFDGRLMDDSTPAFNPDAAFSGSATDSCDCGEGGSALLDSAGRIHQINEGLCTWLEQSVAELAGRNLWELLASRCPDWSAEITHGRATSETFVEMKLRRPGDSSRSVQWFSLELARYPEGCCVRLNSTLPPLADLEEG